MEFTVFHEPGLDISFEFSQLLLIGQDYLFHFAESVIAVTVMHAVID